MPGSGIALLAVVFVLPAQARERALWGELQPGPFDVGFRSHWELDATRDYDTRFADGSRYATSGRAPRPILVNAWYPADAQDGARRMPHRGYLEIPAADERLERLSRELATYEGNVIAEWTLGKLPSAFDEADTEAFEQLLDTATACIRDAAPADGCFPLVIYHAGYGSSFEDNSVLCEYLASHGYFVVGSAFQAEEGGSFNIDGGEGSARDLAFLVGHLSTRVAEIDRDRVAVIGHSGGAHAILRFQAWPSAPVDVAISLDTTQDYVSVLDPHWSHPAAMLESIETQTTPLLVVAKPHAFFQLCDALVMAERTYLTFRDLDHNDFTSQGVFLAEIAARRARASNAPAAEELEQRARTIRRGYTQCVEYQRLFLDARLKRDGPAAERLARMYRDTELGGPEPHVELAAAGDGAPEPHDPESSLPPTPRQVRPLIAAVGAAETLEILARSRAEHPDAPVYDEQFAYALLLELVLRRRLEEALLLAPFFLELHPNLLSSFTWWVERSRDEPRYADFCIAALRTARLLAPEDPVLERELAELEERPR